MTKNLVLIEVSYREGFLIGAVQQVGSGHPYGLDADICDNLCASYHNRGCHEGKGQGLFIHQGM